MEDAAIITLYWARDQRAIAATEEKYGRACRALATRLLDSREDGEECVNDTWHRAWDTIPPQRPDSLRAYLMRIVRNLAIDRWRGRQAQKRGAGLGELALELEDCLPAAPSAERAAEEREVAACMNRWLDAQAFVRRYWYGWRVDELAKKAGCSPNGMAQRLRRLRGDLRRALEQEGIEL